MFRDLRMFKTMLEGKDGESLSPISLNVNTCQTAKSDRDIESWSSNHCRILEVARSALHL